MKRNNIARGCIVLTGALILTSATLLAGRHGVSSGATAFELSLTRSNGGLTNASYSSTAATGKAKTTQGNDFVFSYKNARRYNTTGGEGFAIFAEGGELISTEGVSGLLSVAAAVNSGSSLYVSFASSATSEFWSEAKKIESDPIESPAGMDYFKISSPDGTSYCQSITIRYSCSGTETDEDPIEPSSEQPVAPEGMGTITFSTTKKEGNSINDMAGSYSVNGLSVSGITVNKYVYGSSDGSLRFSSSSKEGNMVITLSEAAVVSYIKIDAKKYGSDIPSVTINTSANTAGETKTVSARGEYEYTSFASDNKESTTITISSQKSNRFYLYSVTLGLGKATPVYPTSISLGEDFELGVGATKTLSVSYSPNNTSVKEVSFSSSNTSVATVDAKGKVTAKAEGTATITATATAESGTVTDTVDVTVTKAPAVEKTEMKYKYSDYTARNVYTLDSAPTIGTTKLLVVPIWFTDSSAFIKESKKETIRSDIEKAYFGTEEETGWHSVKSFYETESMGALSFEGTVSSWYSVNASYKTYGPEGSGFEATITLASDVVSWYFENNSSESRKDYDRDGDGYLDGVMLIYAAPDCASLGLSKNDSYTNLWAYCYWLQEESNNNRNNPGPNTFFWSSYDFMYDSSTASTKTGKSDYSYGDNSHCIVDAHTFIHEMGHVFGLNDYYDYGENGYSHAGGFSMQDYNVGGHDPFSVMAYGWASPYIPTTSCQITISTFQKSHDVILLTPSWNSFDSPWDEYLLLELYSPTGLNELDATYSYAGGFTGADEVGIRLWHVDARLTPCNSLDSRGNPIFSTSLTSDLSKGTYGTYQAFTNTVGDDDYGSVLGSSYEKYNLLKLIRNNTSAPLHALRNDFFENSHLFGDGSAFSMSYYSSQFANKTKLNSGAALGWTFSVAINGTGHDATATITLNRA